MFKCTVTKICIMHHIIRLLCMCIWPEILSTSKDTLQVISRNSEQIKRHTISKTSYIYITKLSFKSNNYIRYLQRISSSAMRLSDFRQISLPADIRNYIFI